MARDILTSENLLRHLQLQTHHRFYEKSFHTSRDLIVAALRPHGHWEKNGVVALLREHERRQFQQKVFALEHPDLHEEFLKVIPIVQLVVTGPAGLAPTEPPIALGDIIRPGG